MKRGFTGTNIFRTGVAFLLGLVVVALTVSTFPSVEEIIESFCPPEEQHSDSGSEEGTLLSQLDLNHQASTQAPAPEAKEEDLVELPSLKKEKAAQVKGLPVLNKLLHLLFHRILPAQAP